MAQCTKDGARLEDGPAQEPRPMDAPVRERPAAFDPSDPHPPAPPRPQPAEATDAGFGSFG